MSDGPAVPGAQFGHVNVIARDWRSLAGWYTRVFGCEFVPPERDYSGPELAAGTGVPDASLQGVHLRLPGLGDRRPDARDLPVRLHARGPPARDEPARLPAHRLCGALGRRGA